MQRQEKQKRLSLHEEITKEAQQIEQELERNPELKDLVMTEEKDAAFFRKLDNLKNEKKEEADTAVEFSEELAPDLDAIYGRAEENSREEETLENTAENTVRTEKIPYRRKKRKIFVVCAAAVLLIVMMAGTTSVGSKSYWKVLWEKMHGGEAMKVINVEDMEGMGSEDGEELAAYLEIEEKLSEELVRIVYKPKNMRLIEYQIDEEAQVARLRYEYQGNIFRYTIYINNSDSSWGEKEEDIEVDSYVILVNGMEIEVKEFQKEDSTQYRQEANFEYYGVNYQLKGVVEREEFIKIVENLRFL